MNVNTLVEVLYAVLDSPAIPLHYKATLMSELLDNLNYEVKLSTVHDERGRLRMTARYHDFNGEADFTTDISIDSADDWGMSDYAEGDQVPRVTVHYRVGKHIIK